MILNQFSVLKFAAGLAVFVLAGCATTQPSIEEQIVGTWEGESRNGRHVTLTLTDSTIDPLNMGPVPYSLEDKTISFKIMGMDRVGVIESVDERRMAMDFGDDRVILTRKQ